MFPPAAGPPVRCDGGRGGGRGCCCGRAVVDDDDDDGATELTVAYICEPGLFPFLDMLFALPAYPLGGGVGFKSGV